MAKGNFGGGTGSLGDPFIVEDLLDLNAIRNGITKSYKLKNDLDCSAASLTAAGLNSDGKGWIPIGGSNATFTGTLDFNLKSIKNLYINRPDVDYVGFFGQANPAEISRARIENADISGNLYVGILTGAAGELSIINCKVSGKVKSFATGDCFVGGLIGISIGSLRVEDCKVELSSLSGQNYVGGVLGYSTSHFVFKSVICTCSGEISGLSSTGGIAGYCSYGSVDFTDVYFLGKAIRRISGLSTSFSDIVNGGTTSFVRVGSMTDLKFLTN